MLKLVAGLVIFLGVHSIRIVAPSWRDAMVERLGPLGWKAVYSVASLAGFILLVGGYAAVTPTITGQAWITGLSTIVVDPTDPFPDGFTVGDIWG